MAPVRCGPVPVCSIACGTPAGPPLALHTARCLHVGSCKLSVLAGCLCAANPGLAAHLSPCCLPPRPPPRSYERSSQFVGRALRMPENANLVRGPGSLLAP